MPLKLYQRNGIWHYRGSVAGRRLRGSCKTKDKTLAAREASEIESREWKRRHDGPGAVLTFAQAAMHFRNAGKPDRFLSKVEDYFKNTLIKDITAGRIRQMAIELYPGCSGATRNRMGITVARSVINFAAESDLCAPIRVRKFKVDAKIKEPATLEWVNAFVAHANPHIGAMCLFMFLTGARIGEAVALQWKDVDLVEKTALLRQTKVSDERQAHLPKAMIVKLANLERIPDRGVFGYLHPDDTWRVWEAAIKKAKIKYLSAHCCRHGFATGLLRRGVDVKTVARLGGWKTAAVVLNTYGHAIEDRTLTDVLMSPELTQKTTLQVVSNGKDEAI
jgi:integrase